MNKVFIRLIKDRVSVISVCQNYIVTKNMKFGQFSNLNAYLLATEYFIQIVVLCDEKRILREILR